MHDHAARAGRPAREGGQDAACASGATGSRAASRIRALPRRGMPATNAQDAPGTGACNNGSCATNGSGARSLARRACGRGCGRSGAAAGVRGAHRTACVVTRAGTPAVGSFPVRKRTSGCHRAQDAARSSSTAIAGPPDRPERPYGQHRTDCGERPTCPSTRRGRPWRDPGACPRRRTDRDHRCTRRVLLRGTQRQPVWTRPQSACRDPLPDRERSPALSRRRRHPARREPLSSCHDRNDPFATPVKTPDPIPSVSHFVGVFT